MWKRNIYIAIIMHMIIKVLDLTAGVILLLGYKQSPDKDKGLTTTGKSFVT